MVFHDIYLHSRKGRIVGTRSFTKFWMSRASVPFVICVVLVPFIKKPALLNGVRAFEQIFTKICEEVLTQLGVTLLR